LGQNNLGMSLFITGLVLIVVGTGHFKPNVSVMVNRLYPVGDPRQDGAFTIFYMGINVGAFIGPLICGYLGEKIGWHWGFGAAAVGMITGLIAYIAIRPKLLPGIGEGPKERQGYAFFIGVASVAIALLVGAMYHYGVLGSLGAGFDWFVGLAPTWILIGFIALILAMCAWFVAIQKKGDGGPVACILVFVLFNAVFWLAYEQAGSSLNHFADEMTNLHIGSWEMPASWFQSVPALMVVVLAPLFAALWIFLARRGRNPSQPIKLALGLFLVGGGYVFMVIGSNGALPKSHSASMFWLTMTYLMHTFGELCMSPTGLSFVTKVAPVKSVSLLMGIWFLSNAVANKVGGQVAGKVDAIASGQIVLPWAGWFAKESQAPFFLFFVILSVGAGVVMLLLTPLLKKLLGGREK
jgi:POT family proton-dependent oligopeptide transporter